MKNIVRFFFPVLCAAMILVSCSIEKRHYRPGYHVEWKSEALFKHRIKTVSAVETVGSTETAVTEMGDKNDSPTAKKFPVSDQVTVQHEPVRAVHNTTLQTLNVPLKKHHPEIFPGKKIEKLIPNKKIIPHISAPKTSDMSLGDDGRLIIGIILLIFGLSPFAVLVYNGAGPEFSLDFLLWIVGLVFLIIGFASGSPGLAAVGWILLVVAFIYAIIAMIRRAV